MIGRCRDVCDRISEEILGRSPRELAEVTGIGASGSETRAIDRIAEDVILDEFPDISVLSEEAGFVDRHTDALLVVDPIDGTKNAIRGLPLYTVSIAVAERRLGDVSFGFMENLATGEVFHAELGKGSFINGDRVRAMDTERMAMLSMDSESHRYAGAVRALGYDIRSLGCSSLEMCYAATGAADFYLHAKASLRVIDIAASLLFLRESGGECYDFAGRAVLDRRMTLEERFGLIAVRGGMDIEDLAGL
jgi:fructose-1,6-bisphosphatase/inositol monophosphatase family enzyme